MKKVLKPHMRDLISTWKPLTSKRRFQNPVFLKFKAYWELSGVTFETLEEEWRQQCPSIMNSFNEKLGQSKWEKRLHTLTFGSLYVAFVIGVLDMIAYAADLEKYVLKGFYIVVLLLAVIIYAEVRHYKQNLVQMFSWLKNLQSPDNELNRKLSVSKDANKFHKALKLSLFISRVIKFSCLLIYITLFLMIPIITTVFCRDIQMLIPLPFKLVYLGTETVSWFVFHLIEQHLAIYASISCLCLCGSIILTFIIHSIYAMNFVENFVKSKKDVETLAHQIGLIKEQQLWIRDIIEATDQLSKILKLGTHTFSNSMYFFEKVCYMEMVVLWLAIKVAPDLLVIAIGQLLIVVFLYTFAYISSMWTEKYNDIGEAIYDLNWYNWQISDQKDLITVIGFLQRPPQIKAIYHDITLEWFAGFIKATYSAGNVLFNLC